METRGGIPRQFGFQGQSRQQRRGVLSRAGREEIAHESRNIGASAFGREFGYR